MRNCPDVAGFVSKSSSHREPRVVRVRDGAFFVSSNEAASVANIPKKHSPMSANPRGVLTPRTLWIGTPPPKQTAESRDWRMGGIEFFLRVGNYYIRLVCRSGQFLARALRQLHPIPRRIYACSQSIYHARGRFGNFDTFYVTETDLDARVVNRPWRKIFTYVAIGRRPPPPQTPAFG